MNNINIETIKTVYSDYLFNYLDFGLNWNWMKYGCIIDIDLNVLRNKYETR